jgi:hypothetical protein
MSTPADTQPSFRLSPQMNAKLPLSLLWAIMLTCCVVGGYVYTLRTEVTRHTAEIKALQDEAKASHELLVRIDENVKTLKERRAL